MLDNTNRKECMKASKEGNTKRFNMNVSIEIHTLIKQCAARKNVSMSLYVLRAVLKQVKEDNKYEYTQKTGLEF